MEKSREAEVVDQNQASRWGKRTENHSHKRRLVDSIVEEPFIGFIGFFERISVWMKRSEQVSKM